MAAAEAPAAAVADHMVEEAPRVYNKRPRDEGDVASGDDTDDEGASKAPARTAHRTRRRRGPGAQKQQRLVTAGGRTRRKRRS